MNLKRVAVLLLLICGLVHLAPYRLGPIVGAPLLSLGFTTVTLQKILGLISLLVGITIFAKKEY